MTKITSAWIKASLELADSERSKITEREKDLFGLSSVRLKSFLNNVCAKENTNYLEIGVYKGSTLISALAGNPKTKAVGVENFKYDDREPKKHAPNGGIWDNMKSQLYSNIDRYKDPDSGVLVDNIKIIESDFIKVSWDSLPKFDVCFFDVSPINATIYDAFFEKVITALAPESVVIFSNYSNEQHADELDAAIDRHKDKVSVQWKEQRISGGLSDSTKYYSGICVLGLKKIASKSITKND